MIELKVEKSEKFLVRRRTVVFAYCPACACQVRMLRPEELAEKAGVSLRTVYRLIEANRVHFTETADGGLFVCRDSFFFSKER